MQYSRTVLAVDSHGTLQMQAQEEWQVVRPQSSPQANIFLIVIWIVRVQKQVATGRRGKWLAQCQWKENLTFHLGLAWWEPTTWECLGTEGSRGRTQQVPRQEQAPGLRWREGTGDGGVREQEARQRGEERVWKRGRDQITQSAVWCVTQWVMRPLWW